ncbi:MAG: HAMP domain-containing histidine kinase [Firmicutes bacterium]|nr:HAMP domain-containing histidine kinase [Bacillota bacterium]
MSIRWRLTLWYTAVLGLTLLLFGVGLYFYMAYELAEEVDASIATKANEVVRSIMIVEQFPFPVQVSLPDVNVFAAPNTFLQVVDVSGRLLARSKNLGAQVLPLSEETLDCAGKGQAFYETVLSGDQRLRIYSLPLIWRNRTIGVLQVGRSLQPVDLTLGRLRLVLILVGSLTVALAGTLGWFLAHTALKPIDEITNTVAAIQEAQDLERRLEYTGPRDEIGRLSDTFNEMLARLSTAYQRLAEANEAQRRFVADASHELRTPLTTIRGNVELLQKMGDTDPDVRAEALADIASEGERMSRLVEDLLVLARADAGLKLNKKPVGLNQQLEEIFRSARHLSNQVEFVVGDLSATEGIGVLANSDYLKQLLLILIDNGVKYTPPGGRVRVETCRQDGWAGVKVIDTGIGIAPNELPHIFERFYRADRARFGEGTGLGLAIAKWIVDEHAGRIEVESAIGRGSTFTVWLPIYTL